jgi:hypothetical protein
MHPVQFIDSCRPISAFQHYLARNPYPCEGPQTRLSNDIDRINAGFETRALELSAAFGDLKQGNGSSKQIIFRCLA